MGPHYHKTMCIAYMKSTGPTMTSILKLLLVISIKIKCTKTNQKYEHVFNMYIHDMYIGALFSSANFFSHQSQSFLRTCLRLKSGCLYALSNLLLKLLLS